MRAVSNLNSTPGRQVWIAQTTTAYQRIQTEERVTIASLKQHGLRMRSIARTLGRSPSSVSRKLRRNARPDRGGASVPERLQLVDGHALLSARLKT